MIDFSEVLDNVKDFYREKKLPAILITIVVVLLFLALIVIVVQGCSEEEEEIVPIEVPLILDQELLTPQGPSVPEGYALSREPLEKWTKEEAKEFFTIPNLQELKKLEESNDKLIDEILGAAP